MIIKYEEIERTKENNKVFDDRNGEQLTQLFLKSDVFLPASVFEKFKKVSIKEFKINPLFCVSLPGYTWNCGLKCTRMNLQTFQDKDLTLTLENNIHGGIHSVMGDRYVKSDDYKKISYGHSKISYRHSMRQPISYDEFEM